MFNFLINSVQAQTDKIGDFVELTNPLKVDTLEQLAGLITRYVFGLASALAVLLVVWSGFQLLLHSDQPDARKKALDRIKWIIIGYAIMLLSGGVVSLVTGILGSDSGVERTSTYQSQDDLLRSPPPAALRPVFTSPPTPVPNSNFSVPNRFGDN